MVKGNGGMGANIYNILLDSFFNSKFIFTLFFKTNIL